jgi:hypothetical protein
MRKFGFIWEGYGESKLCVSGLSKSGWERLWKRMERVNFVYPVYLNLFGKGYGKEWI